MADLPAFEERDRRAGFEHAKRPKQLELQVVAPT